MIPCVRYHLLKPSHDVSITPRQQPVSSVVALPTGQYALYPLMVCAFAPFVKPFRRLGAIFCRKRPDFWAFSPGNRLLPHLPARFLGTSGGNVLVIAAGAWYNIMLPSVDKGKHGFSGRKRPPASFSSLPGASPAASSASLAAVSAPEKLRRTFRRAMMGSGEEEDDDGLTPT